MRVTFLCLTESDRSEKMMRLEPAVRTSTSPLARYRMAALLVSASLVSVFIGASLARAANFGCSWASAVTANWTTAGDWNSCNNTFPNNGGGNTYDATVAAVGSNYTVTLNS